jgi:nicotinamidase-related amidase
VLQIQSAYLPAPHETSRSFPGPLPSPELQKFESYLTSTHTASRFCTPGSLGAGLLPDLTPFRHPDHILIEKSWYSTFTDTSLHATLQPTGASHRYVTGVTTNTCVAATSVHACWFHRLRNVVSSNKGIFLIDDDQEAGIASKTDGG